MRRITWVVLVGMFFTPVVHAFEPHPLKAWVASNPGKVESRAVDEKVAASQARRKALRGALIGGLAAGVRAAVLQQDVGKAVAVGAAAGAIAGYVVGKMEDRRIASREALAERMGYDAAQGIRAEVTRMSCDPCRVKPGQKFNVTVSYWVMAPERGDLAMSRHLGIGSGGSYIRAYTFNPDPFTIPEGGGEFETTIEYSIGAEGTYTMEWLVESETNAVQQAKSMDVVVTNA